MQRTFMFNAKRKLFMEFHTSTFIYASAHVVTLRYMHIHYNKIIENCKFIVNLYLEIDICWFHINFFIATTKIRAIEGYKISFNA